MGKLINALFSKEEIPAQAIPLDRAVLCLDCETIYDVSERHCPKCAGEVWINIGLALGDEPTKLRVTRLSAWNLEHRTWNRSGEVHP